MERIKINQHQLKTKCKKIKLIATDVDGVLTDGGRYFSDKGEKLKKFHTRDGMAVNILLRNGIKTVLITKESSKIVYAWARQMNVSKVYSNSIKKEETLEKVKQDFKLTSSEIAYIGDDVNDVGILKRVGLSATPNDGVLLAKKHTHYVCGMKGGDGAFREFADLILYKKYSDNIKWY